MFWFKIIALLIRPKTCLKNRQILLYGSSQTSNKSANTALKVHPQNCFKYRNILPANIFKKFLNIVPEISSTFLRFSLKNVVLNLQDFTSESPSKNCFKNTLSKLWHSLHKFKFNIHKSISKNFEKATILTVIALSKKKAKKSFKSLKKWSKNLRRKFGHSFQKICWKNPRWLNRIRIRYS